MAEDFGLVRKGMRPKLRRRSFFTPEGKVAMIFLKMYTGLSCPKLLEQLNGDIHYQIFCDVIIDPTRPLTNYKLLDDVMMELAGKLKMQQLQGILADKWRPYMENLDTMYTDATCYESEMRYPTDAKLLWEGVEKSYATMCELSGRLFALPEIPSLWNADESEGQFLLSEIMAGGNFVHGDTRFRHPTSRAGKLVEIARRNIHLLSHYESDALAAPFYYIWHFFWKRIQICSMWFRCRA